MSFPAPAHPACVDDCACEACARLDLEFPGEGRQLAFPADFGGLLMAHVYAQDDPRAWDAAERSCLA